MHVHVRAHANRRCLCVAGEKERECWCGASRAGGRVRQQGKLVHKHQQITSACVARTKEPHDCSPQSPPRLFGSLSSSAEGGRVSHHQLKGSNTPTAPPVLTPSSSSSSSHWRLSASLRSHTSLPGQSTPVHPSLSLPL